MTLFLSTGNLFKSLLKLNLQLKEIN